MVCVFPYPPVPYSDCAVFFAEIENSKGDSDKSARCDPIFTQKRAKAKKKRREGKKESRTKLKGDTTAQEITNWEKGKNSVGCEIAAWEL